MFFILLDMLHWVHHMPQQVLHKTLQHLFVERWILLPLGLRCLSYSPCGTGYKGTGHRYYFDLPAPRCWPLNILYVRVRSWKKKLLSIKSKRNIGFCSKELFWCCSSGGIIIISPIQSWNAAFLFWKEKPISFSSPAAHSRNLKHTIEILFKLTRLLLAPIKCFFSADSSSVLYHASYIKI